MFLIGLVFTLGNQFCCTILMEYNELENVKVVSRVLNYLFPEMVRL